MEQKFRENVARNLATYRKLNNLTQLELAEKLNYSDKSVSKWERGDGLPDLLVLKTIADFYGITLNDLVANEPPKKLRSTKRQHIIVPLLSVAIAWLVAIIVFMVLSMLPMEIEGKSLVFLYAVPVSFIIFTVYSSLWWSQILQFFTIVGIIWTVALCIFVTINLSGIYLIWCVAAVLQVMEILWFILKYKKSKKLD